MAVALGLMPEGVHVRLREDPEYFERDVRASISVIDALAVRRDRFPLSQWFDDHECGLRIAYVLLREHCRVCLQAKPPVGLALAHQRAGVLGREHRLEVGRDENA